MLDSIFYFQIVIGVAFFAFGFLRKESSFMALAAVILGVTGLMLLSGVPIEYSTGEFSVLDVNSAATSVVPILSAHTIANDFVVYVWALVLFFVGTPLSLLLALNYTRYSNRW